MISSFEILHFFIQNVRNSRFNELRINKNFKLRLHKITNLYKNNKNILKINKNASIRANAGTFNKTRPSEHCEATMFFTAIKRFIDR